MARETSSRIKKYGVCLNNGCAQYTKIQEIVHGDMECPECHKKLSPCAPPKKKSSKNVPILVGGVVLLIAIIGGCLIAFSGGSEEENPQLAAANTTAVDSMETVKPDTVTVVKTDTVNRVDTVTVVKTDTVKQVDTVTVEKIVEKPVPVAVKAKASANKASGTTSGSGSLRLSYGKYSGGMKNGYPHGQGRLTYTHSRQINRNDVKGRMADAGDYIIGEFYNGFVVYGKHYDASGNLIGSLNFGVGSENSYDSK